MSRLTFMYVYRGHMIIEQRIWHLSIVALNCIRVMKTYPYYKTLPAIWINSTTTCYELQQQNPKCENISLLIHKSMHEILWSQIPAAIDKPMLYQKMELQYWRKLICIIKSHSDAEMPTRMFLQLGRQHGGPTYLGATLPIQNLKSAVHYRMYELFNLLSNKYYIYQVSQFYIVARLMIQSTSASSLSLSNMFEALMSLWMILLGQSWWRYCNPLATPTATLNLIFHSKHSEPEILNVTFVSQIKIRTLSLFLTYQNASSILSDTLFSTLHDWVKFIWVLSCGSHPLFGGIYSQSNETHMHFNQS